MGVDEVGAGIERPGSASRLGRQRRAQAKDRYRKARREGD
jgi:hypothetical protein